MSGDSAPSRPRAISRHRSPLRWKRIIAAGVAVVAVAVGVVLALVLPGGKTASKPTGKPTGNPPTTLAAAAPSRCPLTDVPAPGGKVPARPAVAVKVGNEPEGARPQSGLNEADIVFDTPAEGGIMRYVVVYQCDSASSIGPTRSVRWVDWHILQAFGHPILAFAGGIAPDVNTVEGLGWLTPADLLAGAQSAGVRITSRLAPDNLYTSTAALWSLARTTSPPQPVFSYSGALPSLATPASALSIDFSPGTDVVWKWDQRSGTWLHTYSGVTDIDALTSQPVTTTNIVVQIVHFTFGPYVESLGGSGDVESQTTGTGPGYLLRGGEAIRVVWHRATASSPWTFTDAAGRAVGLAPGRTWVEILLDVTADTPGALSITR
jgi:Protein of unknown function (DUF3048) N-terminal domain/Protein of unknown function (DUF3048) C-terminal domain